MFGKFDLRKRKFEFIVMKIIEFICHSGIVVNQSNRMIYDMSLMKILFIIEKFTNPDQEHAIHCEQT